MMNEPTNSAISAKTSRKVLKKLSALLMSPESASASCWPVSASVRGGSTSATRSRKLGVVDAAVAESEDLGEGARLTQHLLGGRPGRRA